MTLPPSAPTRHDWKITTPTTGSSTGFSPVVIATCRRCGTIRTAQWPGTGREGKIDLSGSCTG